MRATRVVPSPVGCHMAAPLADLTERELRGAVGLLQSLAEECGDCSSFIAATLDRLTGIVASDLTTLSLCDLERGTRQIVGRQAENLSQADRSAFDVHFHEHPLVRFHSTHPRGPTQRISDCMDVRLFRNSAVHADYYRRIGIDYVMALPLRIDRANVISVVFNRSRFDFKDSERALLDTVRQPLAAIYRNLVVSENAGIGLRCISHLAANGGWQIMRISVTGRILEASPAVLALMRRFFPREPVGRACRLPGKLCEWLLQSRGWGLERPAIDRGQACEMTRFGAKLTVHFVPDTGDVSAGFLLMKSERTALDAADLSRLPVTHREREILALVAGGKTNSEIAVILEISARTVQKHLEHVFQKIGVETRTAAAVHALAVAEESAFQAA